MQNDTLRQTGHDGTPVYRYEKADSAKRGQIGYVSGDPWIFYFNSYALAFVRVQNDTLIASSDNGGEIGLIKKK